MIRSIWGYWPGLSCASTFLLYFVTPKTKVFLNFCVIIQIVNAHIFCLYLVNTLLDKMLFVCLYLDMIVEVFRFGKRRQLAQLESCSKLFHRIIDFHFRTSPFLVFKANFVPPFKCSSPSDARCYRILPSPFKNENEPYTEETVRFSMLLKKEKILIFGPNLINFRTDKNILNFRTKSN